MRLLVTGSSGFVGGSIGRYAAGLGHDVLGISRSSQPQHGWSGDHVCLDVAQADLTPAINAFRPDAIFHGAGAASVGASLTSPVNDFRASVVSWINLLDAVRRSVQRPNIMFPSSAAVYGNPPHLPVAEDAALSPISPYGFHKLACELVSREYTECFDINISVVRIFSLFGSSQRRLLVWELFKQATGMAAEIRLVGTGYESRDYLHVDDFAREALALLFLGVSQPINVASGIETTVLQLAAAVQLAAGTNKPVICMGHRRPGDPVRWCADIKRLAKCRGATHQGSDLSAGIRQCVHAWMNDV